MVANNDDTLHASNVIIKNVRFMRPLFYARMVRYNFSALRAFKITHHERFFTVPLMLSVLSRAKNVSKHMSGSNTEARIAPGLSLIVFYMRGKTHVS